MLEDDLDRTAAPVPPVIVIGGPASARDEVPVGGATFADLTLADGTTVRLPAHGGRVDVVSDLPFGCHDLRIGDATATLVVAPPTMPHDARPRRARRPVRAGLRAVDARRPAAVVRPSGRPRRATARARPRRALDAPAVRRVPRRPVRPQPVLAHEPAALERGVPRRCVVADRRPPTDWTGWSTGRRWVGAAGGSCWPPPPTSTGRRERPWTSTSGPTRTWPTTPASGRARPDTVDAAHPAELVQRSHVLAQYLATRQLAAIEGPGRADLALDLPIGGHPAGYETWAHPSSSPAG